MTRRRPRRLLRRSRRLSDADMGNLFLMLTVIALSVPAFLVAALH